MIEYRLARRPVFDSESTVAFGIAGPDGVEAWLRLDLSRAAWEAQGSPEELTFRLSQDLSDAEA